MDYDFGGLAGAYERRARFDHRRSIHRREAAAEKRSRQSRRFLVYVLLAWVGTALLALTVTNTDPFYAIDYAIFAAGLLLVLPLIVELTR